MQNLIQFEKLENDHLGKIKKKIKMRALFFLSQSCMLYKAGNAYIIRIETLEVYVPDIFRPDLVDVAVALLS